MSAVWSVLVGNLGQVYCSPIEATARREWAEWCDVSRAATGRAAGEPVTLLKDGVPVLEYAPENDLEDELEADSNERDDELEFFHPNDKD